ncbi:hypothetical protein BDQ12DRAFT_690955 [Crucibulum laeve]|uniref:Secreted protein n=1 Tax=Crucibulum laeve TaxID=68775 RepID=A0A5C3LL83_9AGAR|nr:hypothetical protein BDQ12DRAFT_690955 [Crucibulum laeve]
MACDGLIGLLATSLCRSIMTLAVVRTSYFQRRCSASLRLGELTLQLGLPRLCSSAVSYPLIPLRLDPQARDDVRRTPN